MNRVYIIAEAGVNHNGDLNIAKKMIEEAKKAGVDAIKFQTFKTENLVSVYAKKADYQRKATNSNESQFDMLKKLEISFEEFIELKEYADRVEIDFLSTPFDLESFHFLRDLRMPYWKIPSGEITNKPFLREIAKTKVPIIMSTGMSTLEEIQAAIGIFENYLKDEIILLHCNTEYPTPYADVNLRAIEQMRNYFKVGVGYSDHTIGIEAAIGAVALGAVVIEKHFTLDRNLEGPDHKSSIEVDKLSEMVTAIRNVESALGNGKKMPTKSEIKNISAARKSIVAKGNIKKGDIFTENNLMVKRPGDGISPMRWDEIIGKRALRDFKEDEKIEL